MLVLKSLKSKDMSTVNIVVRSILLVQHQEAVADLYNVLHCQKGEKGIIHLQIDEAGLQNLCGFLLQLHLALLTQHSVTMLLSEVKVQAMVGPCQQVSQQGRLYPRRDYGSAGNHFVVMMQ